MKRILDAMRPLLVFILLVYAAYSLRSCLSFMVQ